MKIIILKGSPRPNGKYDKMVKYLGWTDGGKILANGIWAKGSIQGTKFLDMAYRYGKELKKLVTSHYD